MTTVSIGRARAAVAARVTVALIAFAAAFGACQPPASPSGSQGSLQPSRAPGSVAAAAIAPLGALQEARVARVSDGDTIEVEVDGESTLLRYIGLDAPEIEGPYADVEWLGPEAAQANRNLVAGQTIFVERDVSDTDRNGRLLRYVWLRHGAAWVIVNRELVRLGFAEAHDYEPDTMYSEILFNAQREAQLAGTGLWGPRPAN
ncbi:MAG: thermonuclease family protein [Candidatus Limnocylindrales bacterium]